MNIADGIVGLFFKGHADTGFLVHVGLSGTPWCEVVLADAKELERDFEMKIRLGLKMSSRETDRAKILLDRASHGAGRNSHANRVQATVSIRRIAAVPNMEANERYVLSVSQETVAFPVDLDLAFRASELSFTHSDSWQYVSRAASSDLA